LVADEETAAVQMALDEKLAQAGRPVFRLFRWVRPALSLGFKQQVPEWCDPVMLTAHDIELVERPTGGGLAVHGSDLSCSVVIPSDASHPISHLMEVICESFVTGIRTFGVEATWLREVAHTARISYCLTEESPYALMVGDRKLGGFAIRRYPASWLVQGSILMRPIPASIEQVMPQDVREAFSARAVALEASAKRAIPDAELIAALVRAWRVTWGIPCFLTKRPEQRRELVHAM
jgi:lipoate-protein ligase A